MKNFTNTSLSAVLLTAFCSLSFSAPPDDAPAKLGVDTKDPWTVAYKQDGIMISYEIMDCMNDHFWLFLKVSNNNGSQRKLRFTVQVVNEDHTIETFNYIKVVAAYSSEKSECGKESYGTGLVRPLKNGNKSSMVNVSFDVESPLVVN